jgi:hypothetical protein
MACRAHVVAFMPCQAHVLMRHCSQTTHHKYCQAPMECFFKRLLGRNHPSGGFFIDGMSSPCRGRHALCQCLGMLSRVVACFVKTKSWHALSSPCRGMPCQAHVVTCLVEACRAHVVACMPCQAHVVACLVPMSWHVKPCRCMPCQDKVVVCLVKPMSLHALSSPCRGMPCAIVLAC